MLDGLARTACPALWCGPPVSRVPHAKPAASRIYARARALSEDALALHRALTENEMLRSANRRLTAALRAAGKVLEPYVHAVNGDWR